MSVDPRLVELYSTGWAPLMGLLISVGGSRDDAEDVVQGAYEKLIRSWPRISAYDDPQAWVRTVAIRDLISRHRRTRTALSKRAAVAAPEWQEGPDGTTPERLDLREALASLSVDHRAVLLLHHVDDLSVSDVAVVLGLSEGTVKSRLSRARAQLAKCLNHPVGEQP